MNKELIELRVNGRRHELAVEPSKLLLDTLREDLALTGSKRGCDDSSCGACTILVDGTPMLACTMLAASYQSDNGGHENTTLRGGAGDGGPAGPPKNHRGWGGGPMRARSPPCLMRE